MEVAASVTHDVEALAPEWAELAKRTHAPSFAWPGWFAALGGLRVLGTIPSSRVLRSRPLEGFGDRRVAAAARALRTNLEQLLRTNEPEILLVTSPNAGDGKTVTSALLAEAFARRERQVLLIDADLRRARLSSTLEGRGRGCLALALREGKPVSELVQSGWVDGLDVLTTETDADAGDLLANRFDRVIGEARACYDVIVVDSPPLLPTDDARTLASAASSVVVVVRENSSPTALAAAVGALEAVRARVVGVVANRTSGGHADYYA